MARQSVGLQDSGYQLWINGDNAGKFHENYLNLDGTNLARVWGNDGLAAANIMPAGTVPEPASYLLAAMAILGVASYARSHKASRASSAGPPRPESD